MIDIHNHIIYAFDDGPKTIEDSLAMLTSARDQGITDVFATSHFNEVINIEMEEDYFNKMAILQREAWNKDINVTIHSGSEMFFHHYIEETIKKNRVGTLGDKGLYSLMEFPLYLMPKGAEEALFRLEMEGIIPIIAHPERYSALHEKPEKILTFIRYGGLLQVNTGSVLGDFGKTVKKISMWLLENQYVHFLGSDAHRPKGRSFKLAKAAEVLEAHLDKSYIEDLVQNNPLKIIQNQKLERIELPEQEAPRSLMQRFKAKLKRA